MKMYIGKIVVIVLSVLFVFLIVAPFTLMIFLTEEEEKQELYFDSLEAAYKEVGRFDIPKLGGGYEIDSIHYYNDGFTHPITEVILSDSANTIRFIIASRMFENLGDELLIHTKIDDFRWISNGDEYILRWRSNNQDSYKYLTTTEPGLRDWLIQLAVDYEATY